MRLTRFHQFLLGGLLVMILGPLALTQAGLDRGGNDRTKGDRSEKMLAMLSGGEGDYHRFRSADFRVHAAAEQMKEKMMAFLQKKGVSDGIMTKALFSEYSNERMSEMCAKWPG